MRRDTLTLLLPATTFDRISPLALRALDLRPLHHGTSGYLRKRLDPEEAEQLLRDTLANRAANFLRIAELGIYDLPDSPYRKILRWAGVELGISGRSSSGTVSMRDSARSTTQASTSGRTRFETAPGGVSPVPEKPTVSLAGSASGVDIAHRLRKAHAKDPIAPLYLAVLGTPPPDVHELISPGGFDEFMAHKTARAVFEVYAPVQERFYERMAQRNPTR